MPTVEEGAKSNHILQYPLAGKEEDQKNWTAILASKKNIR